MGWKYIIICAGVLLCSTVWADQLEPALELQERVGSFYFAPELKFTPSKESFSFVPIQRKQFFLSNEQGKFMQGFHLLTSEVPNFVLQSIERPLYIKHESAYSDREAWRLQPEISIRSGTMTAGLRVDF